MSLPQIANCPWCSSTPRVTVDSHDERLGYNHTVHVACCATMSVGSKKNDNGWCAEEVLETKKRAIARWNTRKTS